MAVYFLTGKLGSGKTLCAVGKIRDYLRQNRRVATNLDLNLTAMLGPESKGHYVRVPDKPRLTDLETLGRGCDEENEACYGLVVLDELGTWFNARSWQDKERLPVINWFLHARKLHWDIFFLVQNMNLVDPQRAGVLAEHVVDCKRTDRLTLPIIGPILNAVGFAQLLPKIHVIKVYYGNKNPIAVGRWWYRGLDLYDCYDTAQIFSEQIEIDLKTGELIDGRKTFTPLPPYHSNRLPLLQSLEKEVKTIRDDIAQRTAKQRKARTMTPGLWMVAGLCAGLIVWTVKGMAEDYQVLAYRIDPAPGKTEPEKRPEKPPVSTTVETVIAPAKNEPLIALLESATVLRPVTYTENGQVQGILKIVKESAEYRLSYAEIRAQGWIVVDGPNSIMLVRSDRTIQLPIAAKYVPVHEVPPGGVASGLGRP